MKKFERSKLAVDKLFIHQLNVAAIIGVLPQEKIQPQNLIIDLEIQINIEQALQTDSLSSVINYAQVRLFIIDYVTHSQFELLESLAGHLANQLLQHYSLQWLRLMITKKPFDMPDISGVSVMVEREREEIQS